MICADDICIEPDSRKAKPFVRLCEWKDATPDCNLILKACGDGEGNEGRHTEVDCMHEGTKLFSSVCRFSAAPSKAEHMESVGFLSPDSNPDSILTASG